MGVQRTAPVIFHVNRLTHQPGVKYRRPQSFSNARRDRPVIATNLLAVSTAEGELRQCDPALAVDHE